MSYLALADGTVWHGESVGAQANLVLLDTEAAWRVEEKGFRSRSANSWLLGQTLRGQVRLTVAAGKVVHG